MAHLTPEKDSSASFLFSPAAWIALPCLSAVLFVVLAWDAARLETPTVDEFAHVAAGCAYWEHGRFDLYAKNPPLAKLATCALPRWLLDVHVPAPPAARSGARPWLYGAQFQRANTGDYLQIFHLARLPGIVFALATAWLLWRWARSLFGTPAASVTTAFFLQSPTLLAHAHLATVDVACTFTIFASVFLLRRALRTPSWRWTVAAGAVWGIALLTKFTAVLLAPVFALAPWPRKSPIPMWAQISVVAATALVVVNLGMGFQGSFRSLGELDLVSGFGRGVQHVLPAGLPVPLPVDWVQGFDDQKRDTEQGQFGSYLFGRWSDRGWWYYDLVALAVKVPLPVLGMILASPFFLWRRRLPAVELAAILLPIFVLGFFFSAFNVLNVGIRYLLPLFPLLYLLTASVWVDVGRPAIGAVAAALLLLGVVTDVRIHPEFLRYFNPLGGGPERGYEVLIDSNYDWGQDLYRLPAALRSVGAEGPVGLLYFGMVDPHLYGIDYRLVPQRPTPGWMAVSVNFLQGYPYFARAPDGSLVWIEPGRVAWLAGREPVRKLGSLWLFDTRDLAPTAGRR